MATFVKFNAFVEHLAEKVHNLGADALTVALTSSPNAPNASSHIQLTDLTQISYTNLSSRVLGNTTGSSSQSAGTYKLVVSPDLVLTSTGGTTGPFRYVVIYNDTAISPPDALIGYYDYGSEITLQAGETLTLDFDQTNGLLTLQ
jgi:hypothetical protein